MPFWLIVRIVLVLEIWASGGTIFYRAMTCVIVLAILAFWSSTYNITSFISSDSGRVVRECLHLYIWDCLLLAHPQSIHNFRCLRLLKLPLMGFWDRGLTINWLPDQVHGCSIHAIHSSVFEIEAWVWNSVHLYVLHLWTLFLLSCISMLLLVRQWKCPFTWVLHGLSQLSANEHHFILLWWFIWEKILTIRLCAMAIQLWWCFFFAIIYYDIVRIDDILMRDRLWIVRIRTFIACKSKFAFLVAWLLEMLNSLLYNLLIVLRLLWCVSPLSPLFLFWSDICTHGHWLPSEVAASQVTIEP